MADERKQSVTAKARARLGSAALAATLVPVATIAASPVAIYAQNNCGSAPCPIPEPSTLTLLAPAAGAWWLHRRRKKQ
jgi:hypothetical protein